MAPKPLRNAVFSVVAKVPRGPPGVNEEPSEHLCRRGLNQRVGDVAAGTALKVEKDGLTLAVFNLDGEFYVLDDNCTHGPGSLSEGYIEGDVVECNFHNGQFNIRTGEVVLPPCMIPMKTYPTTIEDDKVFIEA